MRVIDSSSLGKYVNKEQRWEEVEARLAAKETSTLDFAMHEVGNSVWKRVLKKEVSNQDALATYKDFVRAVFEDGLVILVQANSDLLNASLELAIQEKTATYDSAFIELAHKNKCELITSDERQHFISKKHYPTMHVTYIR